MTVAKDGTKMKGDCRAKGAKKGEGKREQVKKPLNPAGRDSTTKEAGDFGALLRSFGAADPVGDFKTATASSILRRVVENEDVRTARLQTFC
jgi:hypothetical protein